MAKAKENKKKGKRSKKRVVSVLDKNMVIVSSPILFKKSRGKKKKWFLIKKNKEGGWDFPSATVRKGESSARASIRIMGEKGGMSVQVLEEAGRAGGATTVKDKTYPLRHIYYLLRVKSEEGEAIGFAEAGWFSYANAIRKLSKREQQMLRQAREELREWEKRQEEKKEENKK
jgi:ADP-ribose pyrophosphatase YjhB (NUDIX family)